MRMFGQEQAAIEPSWLRRLTFNVLGNPHPGARLRLRALLEALAYLKRTHGFELADRSVLDAGAGKGEYSFALAAMDPSISIMGFELDEEKVRRAQALADAQRLSRVRFKSGDLTHLQADGEYDLAVCIDVLQYIPDDVAALAAICRALKPGGKLVLHVPNLVRAHLGVTDRMKVWEGYSARVMRERMERAGLNVLRLSNPIGLMGQWADDLCEAFTPYPLLRGLCIPIYTALLGLERLEGSVWVSPTRAGLLAVAQRPANDGAVCGSATS
jgi:2-polyprenyl-3-methyl-5-hydroxy-6-metoxy-1,4-benzoquinol methylase